MSEVGSVERREDLPNPGESIETAAWEVVVCWDALKGQLQGLEPMQEKIQVLRQALTDGDSMGLLDPRSPYFNSTQSSH